MKRELITPLFLLLFFLPTAGQSCESGKPSGCTSRQERVLENARRFIGKPYVGGVLEKTPERLVIETDSVDCLTLVEYALAMTFADEKSNFSESFEEILQQIRYRDGVINNYTDRLHYTLEWKLENCENGLLTDVTAQCSGAIKTKKKIDFMSTHANSYKQLAENPLFINKIRTVEERLSQTSFHYIPCEAIASCEKNIRAGDIILFTTTITGLDIAHLGIATTDKNGTTTFIHASSDAKRVIVNPEPLSAYCEKMKRTNGIIVLRITETAH